MTANLTKKDGEVQFAYAREYGEPWHKLGKPVDAMMTIDQALEMIDGDDVVEPGTIFMRNEDTGELEEMPGKVGLRSNKHGPISVAGVNYEIIQRREILELAYDVCDLSTHGVGDTGVAAIDTIGNIGPHAERFFAYLRTPKLYIDPGGINDEITTGILVATSFDSSLKNTICRTDTRAVCSNTVQMGIQGMADGIQVRHTVNAEQRIRQAARALEYAGVLGARRVEEIEQWLDIPGDKALEAILNTLWNIDDKDMATSTKSRRIAARGSVRYFYEGEGNTCKDLVGANAWAAYNALTEYLDHHRPIRDRKADGVPGEVKRAETALFISDTYKVKKQVSEIIKGMKVGA